MTLVYGSWPPDSVEKFRMLWKQGEPFSAIAKQMQISRSAAVGKAHRLGLKRGKAKRASEPDKKARPIKAKAPIVAAPEIQAAACTIFELKYRSCRFPLWSYDASEPISGKFYCGAARELPQAYCRKHASCTAPRRGAA